MQRCGIRIVDLIRRAASLVVLGALSLLALIFSVGCGPVPEPLRGTWYEDSELSQHIQMSFALAQGGKGRFSISQETHELFWKALPPGAGIKVPSATEMPEFFVAPEPDGRLLARPANSSEGGLHFRSERELGFVRDIKGEWESKNVSLECFENGWALLRTGVPVYVRLERRGNEFLWSYRLFEKRVESAFKIAENKKTIALKFPNGEWTILERKPVRVP